MDRLRWTVLAAMLAAMPVQAANGLSLDRLRGLVEAGRMEQAYELAADHLAEQSGNLRFDFYYGLAAVDTGHVGEGVFALERVLMRRPGLDRARLEYARGLFLQGDDRKAQRQFEIVLANDPPPAVVDRVERYLAAIERRADSYRATVTGHVGTAVGYDDNVNRAPESQLIDLGFGTLQLGSSSREQDAAFLEVNGRVDISRPLRPGLNVVASLRGDVRWHDDQSQFDTSRGGGRLGLRWTGGGHRLSGFLEGDRLYVGNDAYQSAGGLSGHYRYRLADRTALHGLARWTRLRYDDLGVLDSDLYQLGAGLSHGWRGAWNPHGRVTVLVGEEEPDDDSSRRARALAQRDIVELRGRFAVNPAPNWSLATSVRWRNSEYDTNTFPFTEARDEDYYRVRVDLDWQPTVHWRVGPFVSYSENDANIGLYDYERSVAGLEARYTFF